MMTVPIPRARTMIITGTGMPGEDPAGLRDKIIHGYFAINYDIVWDVITRKIPELEPKIRALCDDR